MFIISVIYFDYVVCIKIIYLQFYWSWVPRQCFLLLAIAIIFFIGSLRTFYEWRVSNVDVAGFHIAVYIFRVGFVALVLGIRFWWLDIEPCFLRSAMSLDAVFSKSLMRGFIGFLGIGFFLKSLEGKSGNWISCVCVCVNFSCFVNYFVLVFD